MTPTRITWLAGAAIAVILLATQSTFMVDQTERAILLQLGKPIGAKAFGPGLHFKLPAVQNVVYFDARLLDYSAQSREILTRDKKTMVVDNYTKWRIVDPLIFYQTFKSIPRAQVRLDDIIYSRLRETLGNYSLIEIVGDKRGEVMEEVTRNSNSLVAQFGVEVADVRIKRTDLPAENERAIFGRMRTERERQAKQYRSEGQEEAAKIRAGAERERTVLLADADRQAAALRGQGEAEAMRIWAEALQKDPAFFELQRSLEAYEKSLGGNTRIILTPESPFLRYMR